MSTSQEYGADDFSWEDRGRRTEGGGRRTMDGGTRTVDVGSRMKDDHSCLLQLSAAGIVGSVINQ